MNELQLSLLGLGVVAIFLVIAYNSWLERKSRKHSVPVPEQSPVVEEVQQLTNNGRQEPQWDSENPLPKQSDSEPHLPEKEATSVAANMPEPLPALTEVEAWVDAIAVLRFYEPRTAGSIRETIEQMGISRFERIEFYTGDAWHLADKLPVTALVSNVRCRLQLVTRRGPVGSDALHEWMRAIESLAQVLSAGLSVESETKLLERAGNLDAFCVRVDALINLNLRTRDVALMVPQFQDKLAQLGLAGAYPVFARLNESGDVDFQVVADDAQGLVSLTMDFPRVIRPDLVVNDMLDLARSLSSTLDAEIVDDGGRVLGEEGMALLSNQVVRLGAMLQAQGIEPGSQLSRRLFS